MGPLTGSTLVAAAAAALRLLRVRLRRILARPVLTHSWISWIHVSL